MSDKYKDIINLPHHTSSVRPRMSRINRAAQFSPFAALTGYEEAVQETARFTHEMVELDEYQIEMLNHKINVALENKEQNPLLSITFFKPDTRKRGGEYLTVSGVIRKVNPLSRTLVLMDGTEIPINFIYDISGEIFERL